MVSEMQLFPPRFAGTLVRQVYTGWQLAIGSHKPAKQSSGRDCWQASARRFAIYLCSILLALVPVKARADWILVSNIVPGLTADGGCQASNQTTFRVTFQYETSNTENLVYLVDGNLKIIDYASYPIAQSGGFFMTQIPFDTIVTPDIGPFYYIWANGSAVQARGATYTNLSGEGARFEFDANALDADCPAAPPPDTTVPTVTILNTPAESSGPFTATFQFSEDVTGFNDAATDIMVTNATVDPIVSVDADTYTALITPTATGAVTIQVPAGAATDGTNLNLASGISTTQFTTPQDMARQQIADFTGNRMAMISGNQADHSRRIDRLRGSLGTAETISVLGFSAPNPARFLLAFQGNELRFAARSDRIAPVLNAVAGGDGLSAASEYANDTRMTVWSEGSITLFDDDLTDHGRFGIVHAGADYLATPDLLLGIATQVDWMSQRNRTNTGRTSGIGWMVGPTLTARLDEGYFFDAVLSAGQSYNEVNPLGTYTDDFTTTRLLASASIIGDVQFGHYSIQPGLSFTYMVERQHAYTDSNSVKVGAQTFAQGQVRIGPRVERAFTLEGGDTLSAFLRVDGISTFGNASDYSSGSLARDTIGLTGEVELGGTYQATGGTSLSLSGSYAGIGTNADIYSGSIRIAISLD